MATPEPRPQGYGDLDRNGSNQYPLPNILPAQNGYQDLSIPMAKEFNTLGRQWSGWHRYTDARLVRSDHWLVGQTSRLSADPFGYLPGAGLTHAVTSDSCYVVDGYVVDLPKARLAVALLDPYTFTASKWHHFYVDATGAVQVGVVNVGVAASPPAGFVHLGTGKTDAIDLVAFEDVPGAFSTPKLVAGVTTRLPRLEVHDTLPEIAAEVEGAAVGFPALRVRNVAGGGGLTVDIGATAAPAIRVDLVNAPAAARVLRATANATSLATLIEAVHAGNAPAARFEGQGPGLALEAVGSATAGYALDFSGGSIATLRARNTVGGSAVEASATAGYAVTVEGDASNPAFAEIKFSGQNARPTTTADGGLQWNTAERQLVVNDAVEVGGRGLWATPGGKATGYAAPANGFSGAAQTAGTVAWVTCAAAVALGSNAPKVGGREAILRFRGEARHVAAGSANTLNLRLFDFTANSALPGSTRAGVGPGDTAGFYLPDTTTGWQRSITFDFRFTVPAAGPRTWHAQIQTATAGLEIRVRDCSLILEGLF